MARHDSYPAAVHTVPARFELFSGGFTVRPARAWSDADIREPVATLSFR